MSEHFALEQRLRNTAQVHLHERLLGSGTVAVHGFGNEFLPRTAFSRNQHRSVGLGDALDGFQHIRQCLALADDVATVELAFLLHRLFFFNLFFAIQCQGSFYLLHQGSIVPRLGDEVICSCPYSFYCQVDASPCRHEDDRSVRLEYLDLLQEGDAFVATGGERVVHVHQYQVGSNGAYDGYRFLGRSDGLHVIVCALQHEAERGADCAVVIDYQYHNGAKLIIIFKNTILLSFRTQRSVVKNLGSIKFIFPRSFASLWMTCFIA